MDHSPLSVLWRHQKVPQESCSNRDTELRKKKHVYGISVQQHLDMSILVSATMARERTYNKNCCCKFHLPRHMTEAVFSTTSFHLDKHINEHPIPDHHHRPGESFILLKQLTLTPIRARFLTDRRLKMFLMGFSTQSCSTGYSVSYDPRFSKSWMSRWCIAVIFSGSTDVYPI